MRHQTDIDKMNTNRNLFFMSLPIFVELLLQLLVGNIDQMMVSRVSQQSVASIVNANQIMNLDCTQHGIYGSYGNFITIPWGGG